MKLTRNRLTLAISLFSIIANLSVFCNLQVLYLRPILSSMYLFFIPGIIISLALKIRNIKFWEYLSYSLGFSLSFIMFWGLLSNWILPKFGVSQPLSLVPISYSLSSILLAIGIIAYLRNKDLTIKLIPPKVSLNNTLFFASPIFFPILSVLGAVSLNNHGPSIFTMMMLGSVAFYVILLAIFRNKISHHIYPWSLYLIAVSLLLMTSLRGWYITGHDIQQEYYVFQLTDNIKLWNIALFRDTYNACLSLNILPTVLSSYLAINDLYIYKLVYQLIFPFSVIGVFLLLRKYTSHILAFLSAFFFISFPTFGNDMPMLNRQEIAFYFFILTLLVLLNRRFTAISKNFLFLLFAFSVVVSHYSTSYITITIFILTYLLLIFIKIFFRQKFSTHLTLTMIIGTLIFTFLWNAQITKTSQGFSRVVTETVKNIGNAFSQDLKSEQVRYSIFNWRKSDNNLLFKEYILNQENYIASSGYQDDFISKNIYQKYPIYLVPSEKLPLTSIGKFLKRLHLDPFTFNYYYKQGSAKLVQLLLVIGFIILVFKKSSYLKKIDIEFTILSFVSMILLCFFIILPVFSIQYGTLRFLQQTLTILALPTVIGCLSIFQIFKENFRVYLTFTFFIIFFLSLYGFIPQLTGGYYPSINLNNQGSYYDSYHTHKSQISTIQWLSKNYNHIDSIQTQSDFNVRAKIHTYSELASIKDVFPVNIEKRAYVILNYLNVTKEISPVYYKGVDLIYHLPMELLNNNKNLIYNSSQSRIYK